MLNGIGLNSNGLNYNTGTGTSANSVIVSSFMNKQITKYAVKTPLGQYFNFGTFQEFESGICGVGKRLKYGNIIVETDIENFSTKEIDNIDNPIRNGGYFTKTRFSKKEFSFKIKIFTNSRKNLEKEIADIKRNLDLKGGKLMRQEIGKLSEINIVLQNIEVGELNYEKGTELTIDFISLDPFFIKPLGTSKTYYNINGNLDINFIINDTDEPPLVETLINIKTITGIITSIEYEVNGYRITFLCHIDSPGLIKIDYKNTKISVNGIEISEFNGKMVPYKIFEQNNIKLNYIGGTSDNYDIYFSYDNIYK